MGEIMLLDCIDGKIYLIKAKSIAWECKVKEDKI
jgi:hypothetical protein